ncbi:MAG: shikimate kinase [Candidatus Omnitrophica bacterium]|nr:shikimate kinase [Candidatus Omnitrophota bacterium]
MNNIYLVGFMGTGKSSVGLRISREIKGDFIDLDKFIEEQENKTISDIFKEKGEPYFRGLEKNFLKDVAVKKNQIIACGGGIVIDPDNIKLMKSNGTMVCLTASPDVIMERTRKSNHRPLLNVPDPQEAIRALLADRQKFYSQADITIDTSEISIKEVATRVLNSLPKD